MKVTLLYPLLLFLASIFIISSAQSLNQPQSNHLFARTRMLLDLIKHDQDDQIIIKNKATPTTKIPIKNQTKLIKPSSIPSKNQTKLIKTTNGAPKNQTKLIKPPFDSSPKNKTKLIKPPFDSSPKNKTKLIKTNSTIKSHFKKLNSTSNSTKSSSDLTSYKNKTTKLQKGFTLNESKSKNSAKNQPKKKPSWIYEEEEEDEDDFISEFRGLPSKFQETFVPDLEIISKTSKAYLTKYNNEFTKGFKPYVGNKYAPTIASIVSFAFIIIPLILVSLIFDKITAYFSIQKMLIFVQVYLAIYFTILGLSTLVTGFEPLRFFYSTSQSTYMCVQVFQTLAYVLYLLLVLMYLILVFSTGTGLVMKLLGLAQIFVGIAVGLHYYITVFHRAVLHQPPKTSWKIHGVYATCFFVICLLGRNGRMKKAYLDEGGEEGKKG